MKSIYEYTLLLVDLNQMFSLTLNKRYGRNSNVGRKTCYHKV